MLLSNRSRLSTTLRSGENLDFCQPSTLSYARPNYVQSTFGLAAGYILTLKHIWWPFQQINCKERRWNAKTTGRFTADDWSSTSATSKRCFKDKPRTINTSTNTKKLNCIVMDHLTLFLQLFINFASNKSDLATRNYLYDVMDYICQQTRCEDHVVMTAVKQKLL